MQLSASLLLNPNLLSQQAARMRFTPARRACSVLPSYYACLVKNTPSLATVTWHLTPSSFSQRLRRAQSYNRTKPGPGCVISRTDSAGCRGRHYLGDVLGRLCLSPPRLPVTRPPGSTTHTIPSCLSARGWGREMEGAGAAPCFLGVLERAEGSEGEPTATPTLQLWDAVSKPHPS